MRVGDQSGQASVELIGVLPFVVLVTAIGWQLVLAGQAAWMSANAARAGARAQTVGRDPEAAARSALPRAMRRGLEVERKKGGAVRVRLRVPLILGRGPGPVRVGATAALPQPGR
jgi:hypothetical protein